MRLAYMDVGQGREQDAEASLRSAHPMSSETFQIDVGDDDLQAMMISITLVPVGPV